MSHSDNAQTVVAAATSQVKLCPSDEEELATWFRLIEAQFVAVGYIEYCSLHVQCRSIWPPA